MSKIVIIGINHAGTAAANTILDNYSGNDLVLFDRNDNISYLGCGTALWIGRQIQGTDGLFYANAGIFEEKGAEVHMETEVTNVDFENKVVTANKGGVKIEESYDKLILATGSLPIMPKIQGMNLKNVESVKLFQNGQSIDELLEKPEIKRIAVVGAGYIGVEIVEAVRRRNKEAFLFEAEYTCLASYYDPDFSKDMDKVLADNGIALHYGEIVEEIIGPEKVTGIKTNKGEYDVDMVIMSIGFYPNSIIGDGYLDKFDNGAYLVNKNQQTSDPNVYAIGDCATVYNNATEDRAYIALATNAVRSGIIAGHNVCGTPLETIGVQGSNGISIYGYKMVSTGLNMRAAKKAGMDVKFTEFKDLQKPGFIAEDNNDVKIKIIYDAKTRRIVGAQMASYTDISMGIHMFSLAIEEKVTIDKLKLLDIFFLPHFNQPYNYITMAALLAE